METNLLIAFGLMFCLALSFLLSGMEAGVFALSRLRIRQRMRAGDAAARVLHQFLENPENFLWTIMVGNTLVNFVVIGWMVSVLHGSVPVHPVWLILLLAPAVFLFFTFFDLLPKLVFRAYPNRLCLLMARPFRVLHLGLRPLVVVVEWFARLMLRRAGGRKYSGHLFGNRDELRRAVQESEQTFTSEERGMIMRVLDLENVTIRQIARPLAEAVTIPGETLLSEAMQILRASGLSRLPVWQERGSERRIAGLFSAESVLFNPLPPAGTRVEELMTPALFLDEDTRLHAALERLQRGGQRLAIVLGRDGRESGLVSLEDILKTIFGEVRF